MADLIKTPATMSSIEISELTCKRHDNVMRDIRNMLAELHGEGGVLTFEDTHTNPQNGRQYPIFRLPRRECLILVSGYSVELRARIIDRWEELERQTTMPITAETLMANPSQLLALTQGYALRIVDLERDMAVMQKDVDALDRIAKTDGTYGVREAAKALQMPERKFTEWLQRNGWCYRQAGSSTLLGYADKTKKGMLTHKLTPYTRPDGTEGARESVRFTAEGMVRLAKSMNVVIGADWNVELAQGRSR